MDGVDHINVYSKGATENGSFNSVEGYWYWLSTFNDRLRTLHGYSAKKLGKESEKIMEYSEQQFKDKICKAIDLKLKLRLRDVADINLPLQHYYQFGGKKVEAEKHRWIIDHIELRVKQLKEYYNTQTSP